MIPIDTTEAKGNLEERRKFVDSELKKIIEKEKELENKFEIAQKSLATLQQKYMGQAK